MADACARATRVTFCSLVVMEFKIFVGDDGSDGGTFSVSLSVVVVSAVARVWRNKRRSWRDASGVVAAEAGTVIVEVGEEGEDGDLSVDDWADESRARRCESTRARRVVTLLFMKDVKDVELFGCTHSFFSTYYFF